MPTKYIFLFAFLALAIIVVVFLLFNFSWRFSAQNQYMQLESEQKENEVFNDSDSALLESRAFDMQDLQIEILQKGSGEQAQEGDLVFVHYTGFLENGKVFDSSIGSNQPFSFTLGKKEVIEGWEKGILGMRAGEKRKLIIPPALAYGEKGVGGVIPPNAVLIFEVEMLKIQKP